MTVPRTTSLLANFVPSVLFNNIVFDLEIFSENNRFFGDLKLMLKFNPSELRKKSFAKAPEPIYRLFFNDDYRKLKVVGVSFFLHKEVERLYFCIRHFKF